MKKHILFALILLLNINFYGSEISGVELHKAKEIKHSSVSINKTKNSYTNIHFAKGIFRNSYSLSNLNYLFFGDSSVLNNELLNEDFENSTGWTFTSKEPGNNWVIGSAVNNGGSKSLYISKDKGKTYEYDSSVPTVVHAYKNIDIPADAKDISFSFDWKCKGHGGFFKNDFFNVWVVTDSFVPVEGSEIIPSKEERVLIGEFNANGESFKNNLYILKVNSFAGKKVKVVFEWINKKDYDAQPPAAIDNIKISVVRCYSPSEIKFENITESSAFMKWDVPDGDPTGYDIYYSTTKIAPEQDAKPKVSVNTNSHTFSGLETNTKYYVWIKSNCGTDIGIWSKVKEFKTNCGVYSEIPFEEGFNSNSESFDCWTILDKNEDFTKWGTVPVWEAFEGDRAMKFSKYDSFGKTKNDDWLISPTIKLKGTYRLRYKYKVNKLGTNNFEVLLSKSGKDIDKFDEVLVPKRNYNNDKYVEEKVFLFKVDADVNIAWHVNQVGGATICIDDVVIEEVEGCPEPIEINAKDIKKNQATLFWDDNFGAEQWEYYVQEVSKSSGHPTKSGFLAKKNEMVVTTDHESLPLKPDTYYEYYVRVNCLDGKYSDWSEPYKFKTACDEFFEYPFREEFGKDSETFKCWLIGDENADGIRWKIVPWPTTDGNQAIGFAKDDTSYEVPNDDWLISPTFKMKGTYRLRYKYKVRNKTSPSDFEVLMSESGTNTSEFKKTLIAKDIYSNSVYLEKTVILANVDGNINIAWHTNTKEIANIHIDDVIIEEVKDCAEPIYLGVKDVSVNKATLLWTDELNTNNYEYFVQISGKGEPDKKGTITTKKEIEISVENETGATLLHNTEYEFFVRAVCGEGKNSVWSGPFEFRTVCGAYSLPFWEGFNKDSKSINCWSVVDKNVDGTVWEIKKETTKDKVFEGDREISFIKTSSDETFINDEWLISPTIKTDGGMYRIKYNYKTSSSDDNEFEVLMSKKGSDTKDFQKKPILAKKVYKNDNYVEEVIFIDNLSGDINFAWHITSAGSTKVFLDNIHIEKVIGIPEPNNIVITNQTANSVDIEWEQFGKGNEWEVIAVPYGEDIPEDKDLKPITVKETKAKITGLNSGKTYVFYVRAIGKDGTRSEWSTGKTGATSSLLNDDCLGAYNIPINKMDEGCASFVTGTLISSTLSSTTKKGCADLGFDIKTDVWFKFTAESKDKMLNIFDVIKPSGNNTYNLSVALYGSDCITEEKAIQCFKVNKNTSNPERISGLEIGKDYYLRVFSDSEKADHSFKICLTTLHYLYVSPVGGDYDKDALVRDVLIKSKCNLVDKIEFKAGDNNNSVKALGYFNRNNSDFPFEEGIVLTTHGVEYVPGPFTYVPGKTTNKNRVPRWGGDPDLNNLIEKVGGKDFGKEKQVSVLEFDFTPIKDHIDFEYIFASGNYYKDCDNTCKNGGALFAAWLTEGGASDIGKNLALVPGTNEPIAVSTISDSKKIGAVCPSVNPKYFDKYYIEASEEEKLMTSIDYIGKTVPMKSETVPVKIGQKYRIKLAIADFCTHEDHGSAVFFKGGSFDLDKVDLGDDKLVSTNNAVCFGEEVILDSELNTEIVTIEWYKDDVLLDGKNDTKLTVTEEGNYKVVSNYKNIKGCPVSGSIKIEYYKDNLNSPEDISFCVNSVSGKEFMDITANEKIMLNDLNSDDYQFTYYLSKEDSENDVNSIDKPTSFEIPKDGKSKDIYVRLFYKLAGCTGFRQFSLVPQSPEKPLSFANQQVCGSYTFKKLPQGQHYYLGKLPQGKEYKEGEIINNPGTYTIYVYSIVGDCYQETSFNLEILKSVENLGIEDIKVENCKDHILSELSKGYSYFTEPNGKGENLHAGDTIRFDTTLYVFAKSEEGTDQCQDSFTITFEECEIFKGISPNGDGKNDNLDLRTQRVTSIRIYNRYGKEVYYHGPGYTNEWHGQDKSGNQLPDGTYYYVIDTRGKTKTGWIQINR